MVAKKSIKDQVYDNIMEDIMQGAYPANAILNERVLVEKYGVSKTPIREALVQLCSERILNNMPRSGYQLCPITPKEIIDAQDLRLLLELAALEKSLCRITPAQLDLLMENVADAQKLAEEKDIKKHWWHNMSFHLLLCSFCDNQLIYNSLSETLKFCCRCAPQYFRHTWEQSKPSDAANHRQLIECIRRKDLNAAMDLLRQDISSMRDTMLNF